MASIDERLQFLVQSTESLHASAQQLHAGAAKHDEQIAQTARNLDGLALMVSELVHVANAHEHCINTLENPSQPPQ